MFITAMAAFDCTFTIQALKRKPSMRTETTSLAGPAAALLYLIIRTPTHHVNATNTHLSAVFAKNAPRYCFMSSFPAGLAGTLSIRQWRTVSIAMFALACNKELNSWHTNCTAVAYTHSINRQTFVSYAVTHPHLQRSREQVLVEQEQELPKWRHEAVAYAI